MIKIARLNFLVLLNFLNAFGFIFVLSIAKSQAKEKQKYARIRLADGFDFPVGKPDAYGYRKARGCYPQGHPGEDWNGNGGGNTDIGDPVYSIATGIVVYSADAKRGWCNSVIVRHAYRDKTGKVKYVDSQYVHLDEIEKGIVVGKKVEKGDKLGTIGTCRGKYYAHLHFEIRKNIYVGMHRSKFKQDYSVYHDPTRFINKHRKLHSSFFRVKVPLDTFEPYP